MLLNGGGIGQIQDIIEALSAPRSGSRSKTCAACIEQLDKFVGYLNDQTDDIIAATDSLNKLAGQVAEQKPVVDQALKTIPDALAVLKDQRETSPTHSTSWASSARWPPTASTIPRRIWSRSSRDLGPVLKSLANAGPALTRSLSFFTDLSVSQRATLEKWLRGDYGNLTAVSTSL